MGEEANTIGSNHGGVLAGPGFSRPISTPTGRSSTVNAGIPRDTPMTEIEREAARLNESTGKLQAVIGVLHIRLEHVMHPESPVDGSNEKESEAGTNVGKILRQETQTVDRATRRLQEIIGRLGL